jgi:hypothetical protein
VTDWNHLEAVVQEICGIFDVYAPPIPVELMLQKPPADLWDEVDVSQLSGSFLSIKERYSPRMSMARLLSRHIAGSVWGADRDVNVILTDGEAINRFARMIIMPEDMVTALTSSKRNPKAMSLHFEVPEDDARQRLLELL